MKKVLSVVLCLIITLSMGTVAFAESSDVVLTYSNDANYEISIPESVNINQSVGKGTIVVDIADANLEAGTLVKVTATSANYDNGWYLVNTKNSDDVISYTIGTTNGGNNVASGSTVLLSDSATSTTLYVTVNNNGKAGTFTDIITFTSEIVNIIDFTVQGTCYQAIEGMIWAEWVDSEYNIDGYRAMVDIILSKDSRMVYTGNCIPEHPTYCIEDNANYLLD